jgi:hypothetical protein
MDYISIKGRKESVYFCVREERILVGP